MIRKLCRPEHEEYKEMVVIGGTIRIDPANLDKAVVAAKKMMTETKKEPGCVEYNFSLDLEDKSLVWLFEEWETEEALIKHFETPHMAEFMQALPTLGIQGMDVHRYDATAKGPVQPGS